MMSYDFREDMSFEMAVFFVFGEEDFSCDRPQEFIRAINEFILGI